MAFNRENRSDAPFRKRGGFHRKRKVCVFCGKDNVIDYKDVAKLRKYVSRERQDSAPQNHRHLRDTPESAHQRHQESPPHGSDALHRALIGVKGTR